MHVTEVEQSFTTPEVSSLTDYYYAADPERSIRVPLIMAGEERYAFLSSAFPIFAVPEWGTHYVWSFLATESEPLLTWWGHRGTGWDGSVYAVQHLGIRSNLWNAPSWGQMSIGEVLDAPSTFSLNFAYNNPDNAGVDWPSDPLPPDRAPPDGAPANFLGRSGYIGLRFGMDDPFGVERLHYGWVSVSISPDARTLTLHAYAWSDVPDEPLLVGESFGGAYDYAFWASSVFGDFGGQPATEPLASFPQNGVLNLVAYAVGHDPLAQSGGELPHVFYVEAVDRLCMTFTRDAAVTDLELAVEASDDLVAWDVIAISLHGWPMQSFESRASLVEETPLGSDARFRYVTVCDGPTLGDAPRRHLRLRVRLIGPE